MKTNTKNTITLESFNQRVVSLKEAIIAKAAYPETRSILLDKSKEELAEIVLALMTIHHQDNKVINTNSI